MNGGFGRCLLPRADLPLLGEDGDGLARGGTADAFPVFVCMVEPACADAFCEAVAPAACDASNAVDSPPCEASETALEAAVAAAAVFFLDSTFLDA